jgi:hypothetical protein
MSQSELKLSYKAQTRGYLLKIDLIEKNLTIEENSNISELVISKTDFDNLIAQLQKIDFNNLALEDYSKAYAVDRAIPATFYLKMNKNEYSKKLAHKSNKEVHAIVELLQSFTEKK